MTSKDKLIIKKELLDVLTENVLPELERVEKQTRMDYRVVGKSDRQKTNWKTDELIFDEEGNPVYEDKWDYVKKEEDELTDKDKARLSAIELIYNALEKLI